MSSGLRNVTIWLLTLVVALVGWSWLSTGWRFAMTDDQIFPLSFGWINWISLLTWSFDFLWFFALGISLSGLLRSSQKSLWALAFGAVFSLIHFLTSHTWFAPDTRFATYFWHFGQYLVPPFAAYAGVQLSLRLTRFRLRSAPNPAFERDAAKARRPSTLR